MADDVETISSADIIRGVSSVADVSVVNRFSLPKKRALSLPDEDDINPSGNPSHFFRSTSVLSGRNDGIVVPGFKNIEDSCHVGDSRIYERIHNGLIGYFIESKTFKLMVMVFIISNTILIGLNTSDSLPDFWQPFSNMIEAAMLIWFSFEILIRWLHSFGLYWRSGWNIFDFTILISLAVSEANFLFSARVLRILRVIRAFRSLNSIHAIVGLYLTFETLVHALPDILNVLFLVTFMMAMFAICGVLLFIGQPLLYKYFYSFTEGMYTMLIVMTRDGWSVIADKLQEVPVFERTLGQVYFIIVLFALSLFAGNLVTPILISHLGVTLKGYQEDDSHIDIGDALSAREMKTHLTETRSSIRIGGKRYSLLNLGLSKWKKASMRDSFMDQELQNLSEEGDEEFPYYGEQTCGYDEDAATTKDSVNVVSYEKVSNDFITSNPLSKQEESYPDTSFYKNKKFAKRLFNIRMIAQSLQKNLDESVDIRTNVNEVVTKVHKINSTLGRRRGSIDPALLNLFATLGRVGDILSNISELDVNRLSRSVIRERLRKLTRQPVNADSFVTTTSELLNKIRNRIKSLDSQAGQQNLLVQ